MAAGGVDPGERLVELLTERGETVASAESLTAGLVAATVADTPGASVVLLGGVVAYAAAGQGRAARRAGRARRRGSAPSHPDVAVAMAEGVRAPARGDVGPVDDGGGRPRTGRGQALRHRARRGRRARREQRRVPWS